MFFGGQTHLVHDTKCGGGGGSSQIIPNSHLVIMVSILGSFKPPVAVTMLGILTYIQNYMDFQRGCFWSEIDILWRVPKWQWACP